MHIVVVHGWQKEASAVAQSIAEIMGTVAYETRQKVAGGGPAVIASFADPRQAETLAANLSQVGVSALIVDTLEVRSRPRPFHVRRFRLDPQALQLESFAGDSLALDYTKIELLLVAICAVGPTQEESVETKRKFSLGKTLLAGGVPMTKEVKIKKAAALSERDETLWLYNAEDSPVIFARSAMNFDGLGDAMQFTRDLNFSYLKGELRRLAPQALYNDLLLNRARLVRVLGPGLDPDGDLDLAFEIVMRSLREKAALAVEES